MRKALLTAAMTAWMNLVSVFPGLAQEQHAEEPPQQTVKAAAAGDDPPHKYNLTLGLTGTTDYAARRGFVVAEGFNVQGFANLQIKAGKGTVTLEYWGDNKDGKQIEDDGIFMYSRPVAKGKFGTLTAKGGIVHYEVHPPDFSLQEVTGSLNWTLPNGICIEAIASHDYRDGDDLGAGNVYELLFTSPIYERGNFSLTGALRGVKIDGYIVSQSEFAGASLRLTTDWTFGKTKVGVYGQHFEGSGKVPAIPDSTIAGVTFSRSINF
ncbi:MAG: hypothetical protein OXR66_04355 [Candidatus Woesearchaeota archaeon]|nr:hypothetical protein [Candidatus Woesearchaeota archaeon]